MLKCKQKSESRSSRIVNETEFIVHSFIVDVTVYCGKLNVVGC